MTADNVLFEIKGLKKNFGDLEVLKGIHTTIRKGEVVVVIGPSIRGICTMTTSAAFRASNLSSYFSTPSSAICSLLRKVS